MKTVVRKQGVPNWRDILNSGYYAVVIPVLVKLQEVLSAGVLDFNWKDLGIIALSGLVTHILRKSAEKGKQIDIKPLGSPDKEDPPFGDPTHPNG